MQKKQFAISESFSKKNGKIFDFPEKPKKLYKSVKKFNSECKSLIFYFHFSDKVFLTISVSPRSKNTNLLQHCFCGMISFCDPHNDGLPKSAIMIDVTGICNSKFSKIQGPLLLSSTLCQGKALEKFWFSFLRQNPDRTVLRKNSAISLQKSRYSNISTFHINWLGFFILEFSQNFSTFGKNFPLKNCRF